MPLPNGQPSPDDDDNGMPAQPAPYVPPTQKPFIPNAQSEQLKAMLYPYLVDKMQRRGGVTSNQAYSGTEKALDQQGLFTGGGGAAAAFAKAASQIGTLGGKSANSSVIADTVGAVNAAAQQRFNNELALRSEEEKALGTDTGIARLVSGNDEADKQRQYLYEKLKTDDLLRRTQQSQQAYQYANPHQEKSDWTVPGQGPLSFDPSTGQYQSAGAPGAEHVWRPQAVRPGVNSPKLMPGYTDADGNPMTYSQGGGWNSAPLPSGATTPMDTKQGAVDAKETAGQNKTIDKILGQLQTGTASTRNDLGANQKIITTANRVLATRGQGENQKGGLDSRQMEEISVAAANLVNGGSGAAQAIVEAMVPHTAGSVYDRVKEYLSGNPTGVDQMNFANRFYDTAEREKFTSGERIKEIQGSILADHPELHDNPRIIGAKQRYFGADYEKKFDQFGNYQRQQYPSPPPEPGSIAAQRMAPAAGGKAPPPRGMIKMQAPDGSTRMVLPQDVQKFVQKGAKVVP